MRASQIRMTPCNRFEADQTKAKISFPPQAQSFHPSHTQSSKATKVFGPPALAIALLPASCLSPSRQVLKKKRSGIGSKRRYFGVQTTRRARPSDSPGREGYKETSGEGRSRGCHHVEEKRLRRIPLQKSPIVHRRLSWFVIVQDKWKEVRGKIEKEEKEI